jgi:hypothetical protein
MKIDKQNFQVFRLDGNHTIMDIDGSSLSEDFDRLTFTFGKYNDQNVTILGFKIWLSVANAELLAHDILSGKIAKLCEKGAKQAKAEGKEAYYPGYDAGRMGTTGKKGKECRSRLFKIMKGTKKPFVIFGAEGPGVQDKQGLINPKDWKEMRTFYMGCTRDQLLQMALMIKLLTSAYVTKEFCRFVPQKDEEWR